MITVGSLLILFCVVAVGTQLVLLGYGGKVTKETIVATLAAWLKNEGLVLCRAPDTWFPIMDEKEHALLTSVAELLEDLDGFSEKRQSTAPIPADQLISLLDTSRGAA